MTDRDAASTQVFEAERRRLLGLAYRMTGSFDDAEDVVQDAWLRWQGVDHATVDRPAAWLTTVTTRLAIDRLRLAERTRATHLGPWLPEPVATGPQPEHTAELAESLTFGFLVLLDELTGPERAVLLLADVFGESFRDIAVIVGRSEAACRQIASRARKRLRAARAERRGADAALLRGLLDALGRGDSADLLALLHPDVVLTSHAGPGQRAARNHVVGADRVARLLLNITRRSEVTGVEVRMANLAPVAVISSIGRHGARVQMFQVDERAGRADAIRLVLDPAKLGRLSAPVLII